MHAWQFVQMRSNMHCPTIAVASVMRGFISACHAVSGGLFLSPATTVFDSVLFFGTDRRGFRGQLCPDNFMRNERRRVNMRGIIFRPWTRAFNSDQSLGGVFSIGPLPRWVVVPGRLDPLVLVDRRAEPGKDDRLAAGDRRRACVHARRACVVPLRAVPFVGRPHP